MEQENNTEQGIQEVRRKYKKLTSVYTTLLFVVIIVCIALPIFVPPSSFCNEFSHCALGYVGTLVLVVLGGTLAFAVISILFLIISFFYWKKCPNAFPFKEPFFTAVFFNAPALLFGLIALVAFLL